jgi:hypothetical protein
MDTIQVSIIVNEEKMRGLNYLDLQKMAADISGIRSPYGYTYCDCLEISQKTNFIVKISYPRFFAGVNAFLISDKTQCTQVQWDFSLNLNNFKREIAAADVKIKKFKAISDYNNKYTFTSLPDEVALFEKDTILKQKRERWHEDLQKDVYMEETLNIILDMKSLAKGKGLPPKLSMN